MNIQKTKLRKSYSMQEKSYFKREYKMELTEFNEKLEQTFKKYFPHGYFDIGKSALFDETSPTYFYRIGLIGSDKDVSNNIRENDPMNAIFKLHNLTIDTITGLGIYCTPNRENEAEKYNAMTRRKMKFFRKTKKKSLQDILIYMDKTFQKMREFINEHGKDIIHVSDYPEYYIRDAYPLEKALNEL